MGLRVQGLGFVGLRVEEVQHCGVQRLKGLRSLGCSGF